MSQQTDPNEFFIDFNTNSGPEGGLSAVRVRLDLINIEDKTQPLNIALLDHPLYRELTRYVMNNHPEFSPDAVVFRFLASGSMILAKHECTVQLTKQQVRQMVDLIHKHYGEL